MGMVKLYRKRLIPNECIELKDDEIVRLDENIIVTRWKSLKPRADFAGGISCYFLKKGIKVSKMFCHDGTLYHWYCDMIKTEYFPETETYIFTDLLADVVIKPDGKVRVLDLDELAMAVEQGLITEVELRMSLMQLNDLLELIYSEEFDVLKQAIEDCETK
ncbi:MAG: DUF402 domain-containing protein [Lachnospiraceae bacterium]|nr:DUF402 domain-containing protein [Lachnospiraceae bacterium]